MKTTNAWTKYQPSDLEKLTAFAEEYKCFLNASKTERECTARCVEMAKARGFVDLEEAYVLNPGDRVYVNVMNKTFMCFVLGESRLEKGMNLLGAHIDSPRLDVKQNPLYEEKELVYLDTHYYGGVKKYQWLAMPLAIHGVVCKKDGCKVELSIGEAPDDPVFCISDLLPHLADEQLQKAAGKLVEGEALDLIFASKPLQGAEKEAGKAAVLALLRSTYGIEEEDLLSAELEVVPAGPCRDAGLDRSMILGYGHDDRVCAYPSLRAVLDYEGTPERTIGCVLVDKEEIGSVGATGMDSHGFDNAVAELIARTAPYTELMLRRCLRNSRMLSSDVSAAFDPSFTGSFEEKNTAFLGHGISFNKYTGSGGKYKSNDANAEYIAKLRAMLDAGDVCHQFGELGRVDAGGGGTIAYICARYGMDVIDSGVPVLSMHAPWELISKADLYEAYKFYGIFLDRA